MGKSLRPEDVLVEEGHLPDGPSWEPARGITTRLEFAASVSAPSAGAGVGWGVKAGGIGWISESVPFCVSL